MTSARQEREWEAAEVENEEALEVDMGEECEDTEVKMDEQLEVEVKVDKELLTEEEVEEGLEEEVKVETAEVKVEEFEDLEVGASQIVASQDRDISASQNREVTTNPNSQNIEVVASETVGIVSSQAMTGTEPKGNDQARKKKLSEILLMQMSAKFDSSNSDDLAQDLAKAKDLTEDVSKDISEDSTEDYSDSTSEDSFEEVSESSSEDSSETDPAETWPCRLGSRFTMEEWEGSMENRTMEPWTYGPVDQCSRTTFTGLF